MNRSLLAVGIDLAENPSWWKRIRHSKFSDPFRRKSVRRIGTKALSFTASILIPIPVVKGLVMGAVKVGIAQARKVQIKYKTGKDQGKFTHKGTEHTALKGKDQGELDDKLAHDVKWGWKALDIEGMDRYRWKVKHGVEMLNDTYEKARRHEGSTASICNDWARAIAKYYYLEKRTTILREKAEVIKALAQATIDWVDKVQLDLANSRVKEKLIDKAAEISAHADKGDSHQDCDDKFCVFDSKRRFWSKHKKITKGVQTITSFTAGNIEDPVESNTVYGKKYWKG